MQILNWQVSLLCLLSLVLRSASAFGGAPGSMTLKVRTPDYIDGCSDKNCRYTIQICIGSGRSIEERCLWYTGKEISNKLQEVQRYLADITFDVDNVGSTFYFNANLSYHEETVLMKTERFKDSIFRFNEGGISLYSEDFSVLKIDISIKCKPGFYPKHKCSEMCFDNPPAHKCNENGQKICLKGYYYSLKTNQCNIDNCLTETTICQNNGTCVNDFDSIKCLCKANFTGKVCEKWDPCFQNQCKNMAHCIKLEKKRDYACQCVGNFYGTYCDMSEDQCGNKNCPKDSKCKLIESRYVCVPLQTIKSMIPGRSVTAVSTNKLRIGLSTKEIKKNVISSQMEKETVRFLQYYPYRNEYTTFVIVIVLVVFMIGCFSITFWVLKIKYFQKKNKSYANYPTLPVMPSIFNPSTYRSGDDNFRRWHSLDDNSFYMCNQLQPEPYHPYRSGSNIFQKSDLKMDSYPDNNYPTLNSPHRMCQSMIRSRMPMLYEPSNVDSCDLNFTVTSISQNNSEKNEEMNNNYILVNDHSVIDV